MCLLRGRTFVHTDHLVTQRRGCGRHFQFLESVGANSTPTLRSKQCLAETVVVKRRWHCVWSHPMWIRYCHTTDVGCIAGPRLNAARHAQVEKHQLLAALQPPPTVRSPRSRRAIAASKPPCVSSACAQRSCAPPQPYSIRLHTALARPYLTLRNAVPPAPRPRRRRSWRRGGCRMCARELGNASCLASTMRRRAKLGRYCKRCRAIGGTCLLGARAS